jgi:hypothetical protein
MKRRKAKRKRFCDSVGGSAGTGGCGPITSSTGGITSTMSWPLTPSASWMRPRQVAMRSWLPARISSTTSVKACTMVE